MLLLFALGLLIRSPLQAQTVSFFRQFSTAGINGATAVARRMHLGFMRPGPHELSAWATTLPAGSKLFPKQISVGDGPDPVAVDEFDGDGRPDLAFRR